MYQNIYIVGTLKKHLSEKFKYQEYTPRPPDNKSVLTFIYFSYILTKICVVGAQKSHLNETVILCTHYNFIWFYAISKL